MYATTQDFIDAFGEQEMVDVTNLSNAAATTINVANLQRNQAKMAALIDGMVSSCPDVARLMPFASPYPPLLIGYELDGTRYFLDSIDPREDVRKRYEDAMQQLRLIGKCEMSLGLSGDTPGVAIETGVGLPDFYTPERIFNSDTLRNY